MANDDRTPGPDGECAINLTATEVALVVDALDSHAYWQLGHELPRDNGYVFVPGEEFAERFWEGRQPDRVQQEAVAAIRACRELAARIESSSASS